MKKIIPGIIIAAVFWFLMFFPATAVRLNFWLTMLVASGSLTIYSFVFGRNELKKIIRFDFKWVWLGLAAAAFLYLLFFAGNYFSTLLFDVTNKQVGNIYATKSQASKIFIGLSLLLWIGPAEEIFWRGFVQNSFASRFGSTKGFIIATVLYAIVHIWAFNFMLFMAALICGIFWGWMFLKFKSLVPGIISHAIWDMVIFVILPIN